MRKLIKFLLCLQFVLSPCVVFAAGKPATTAASATLPKAEDFKVQFVNKDVKGRTQEVIYSLDTIDTVLQDLDWHALAAGDPITQSVADTVMERLNAAIDLISVISADHSLTKEQRKESLIPLLDKTKQILYKIIRHHGEDEVSDKREIEPLNPGTVIPQVAKRFSSCGVIDGCKAAARYSFMLVASVFKEFYYDLGAYAPIPRISMNNEWTWGPLDRIRRDQLGIAALRKFQQNAALVMEANPKDKFQVGAAYFDFWHEVHIPRMVQIRKNRLAAQVATTATYFATAAFVLAHPLIDAVGFFDGSSENSLFASSVIYATTWLVAGLLKMASISTTTVQELNDFAAVVEDPSTDVTKNDDGTLEKVKGAILHPFKTCVKLLGRASYQASPAPAGK